MARGRDEEAAFDVGYRLKKAMGGAPRPPKLCRLALPPAKGAKSIGWLTSLFANLQAESAGRRDGRIGTPKRDAPPFKAEKELGILAKRKSRVRPVADYLREIINRFVDWTGRHRPINKIENVPAVLEGQSPRMVSVIQQQTQDKLDRIEERFRREIADAQQREKVATRTLAEFKRLNGLEHRDAEYADTVLKPLTILLAAFLIDGVANATFFSGASSSGFVGGLVVAFILSAMNLMVGVATGLVGMRLIRHREAWRRYFGWPALILGVVFLLLINFTIAHFREVAEVTIRQAQQLVDSPNYVPVSIENMDMSQVIVHMVQHPFEFGTIYSYLLFFTGLMVAIAGFLEGYRGLFGAGFFDPYWGFAGADRRIRRARARMDSLRRLRRNQLDLLFENHKTWASLNRQTHDHFRDQIDGGMAILVQQLGNTEAYEDHVGSHAKRLVRRYQQANEQERVKQNLEEVPGYFGNDPSAFEDWASSIPYADLNAALTRGKSVIETIAHNIHELDTYLAWLAVESQQRNRTEFA